MALTAEQAATIARRHGLTLQDAAALRALADDETAADKIAGQFAVTSEADDQTAATRKFARNLFADAAKD